MSGATVGRADEREPTVGGVVLAAGTSARYGPENKLLTPLSGTPMVARVAETGVESTLAAAYSVDAKLVTFQQPLIRRAGPESV